MGSSFAAPAQSYDERPARIFTIEGDTVAALGTKAILSVPAGTAGTVRLVQLALIPDGATNANVVVKDSNLRFYQDQAGSPEEVDLGTFFYHHGTPPAFDAGRVALQRLPVDCTQFGARRGIEINFTDGCVINYVNVATDRTARVFSQVEWLEGAPVAPARRKRFKAHYTPYQGLGEYAAIDLLPQVDGRGEIEGIYMIVLCNTSNNYLEGDMSLFLDGVEQRVGGTEDFFGGQYYFDSGLATFRNEDWGVLMNDELQGFLGGQNFSAGLYRYFPKNTPFRFNTSAKMTWNNGESGQAASHGSVGILACVTYYLDA